ncbi:hypothetical protein SFRURICE_018215, partial [Spodoptera frugiperda]
GVIKAATHRSDLEALTDNRNEFTRRTDARRTSAPTHYCHTDTSSSLPKYTTDSLPRLAPQHSGPKRPKSLSTLNLKLPYIKGLSFSKQVFVKDILFFNIKAPTQELRLHLI